MAEVEEWRVIEDFPAYEVSSFGRVRRGGKCLKPNTSNTRCLKMVSLYKNREHKGFLVARLVASAFISKPLRNSTVHYKDDNAHNCKASNLVWKTLSEIAIERYRQDNPLIIAIRKDILSGLTHKEIAKKNGVAPKFVSQIFMGWRGISVLQYKKEVAKLANDKRHQLKRNRQAKKMLAAIAAKNEKLPIKIIEHILPKPLQSTQTMFDGKPLEIIKHTTASGAIVSLPRVKFLENRI